MVNTFKQWNVTNALIEYVHKLVAIVGSFFFPFVFCIPFFTRSISIQASYHLPSTSSIQFYLCVDHATVVFLLRFTSLFWVSHPRFSSLHILIYTYIGAIRAEYAYAYKLIRSTLCSYRMMYAMGNDFSSVFKCSMVTFIGMKPTSDRCQKMLLYKMRNNVH